VSGVAISVNQASVKILLTGDYKVRARVGGCWSAFSNVITGLDKAALSAGLSVFPIPTSDLLHVTHPDLGNGKVSLSIVDMNGRVIMSKDLQLDNTSLETTLDMSSLARGAYTLRLATDKSVVNRPISKQ
jgi:hypothetical protein